MKRLLVAASIAAGAGHAGRRDRVDHLFSAEGDAASAGILVGMVDVISIAQAKVEAGGKKWATDAAGDARIRVGQAFENAEKIVVDFTDDGVSSIVASLQAVQGFGRRRLRDRRHAQDHRQSAPGR